MPKEKIYIAAPFFNPVQIALVQRIETLLTAQDYAFYSPRLHSGSAKFTPEMRQSYGVWAKVHASNVNGLEVSDVVLSVIEYALPEHQHLALEWDQGYTGPHDYVSPVLITELEIPDTGVSWEMGYAFHLRETFDCPKIIAFHSTKPTNKVNLMISHGCDGFIRGFKQLEEFFLPEGCSWSVPTAFGGEVE